MQTIKTNPILKYEKKFNLDQIHIDLESKNKPISTFYNYAADRPAEISGFIDMPSSEFIKSLGLDDDIDNIKQNNGISLVKKK